MTRAHDEAVRLASDPSTPLKVLHELAMTNPAVHPLLAENPATYPDLLTWLSSRGNPEVNAALARRAVASAESARAATPPSEPAIEDIPTSAMGAVTDETVISEPAHPTEISAPTSAPVTGNGPARTSILAQGQSNDWNYGTRPTQRYPQQPSQQPPAAAPVIAPAAQPAYAAPAEEPDDERRKNLLLWLILGLVAIFALIGILFAMGILGGDDDDAAQPTTEQTDGADDPTSAEPSDEPSDAETDESSEEEIGPDTEAAGNALIAALAETTCRSASDDAAHSNAFAAVVDESGQGWDSMNTSVVGATLDSLQLSCNPGYALDVKNAADLDGVDLGDWLVPIREASGAVTAMTGFSSPSGNIHCTLGETSAYCTISEYNFTPQENCSAGRPATVLVDGESARFECGNQASGGQSLAYEASATNGIMACTSTETGVDCWNTLTGAGFKVARAAATFTPQTWGPGRQ